MRDRLVKNSRTSAGASVLTRSGLRLQRQCACGSEKNSLTESCSQCSGLTGRVQRKAASESQSFEAPDQVHDVLRSPGRALDSSTRAFMEPRFGHNLSHVRVHTDAAASASAHAVNAHAYTVGHNIVFGNGRFTPGTHEGKKLLAHELAHTIQQRATTGVDSSTNLTVGRSNDDAEIEADRVAHSVINAGTAGNGISAQVGNNLRRQEKEKPTEPGAPKQEEGKEAGGAVAAAPAAGVCTPTGFSRADYLKQPGTSTKDLGLTVLSGPYKVPAVNVSKTATGFVIDPTDTSLPPMTSVYTNAGTYIEDETTIAGQNPGDCPTKRYPIEWTIDADGAKQIAAGEEEHCADFKYAFAVSLRRYADVVNDLSAKQTPFASLKAAEAAVTKKVGAAPSTWSAVFECLAKKTRERDTRKWHDPFPFKRLPSRDNGCTLKYWITKSSLPHVGTHPTADLIKGCNEGTVPKAVTPDPPPAPKTEAKVIRPKDVAAGGVSGLPNVD